MKVALSGFLSVDEAASFARTYRDTLAATGWSASSYTVLVDARAASIQPREVASIFAQLVQSPATRARRVAVVLASQLAALQAKLVFEAHADMAVFSQISEAQSWLDEA